MKRSLKVVCAAVLTMAVAAAVGCGSDDGDSGGDGSGGLPETVKISQLVNLTGPVAVFDREEKRGVEMAVQEINSTDFLDGSKIEVDYEDAQSDQQRAVQLVSQVVRSDSAAVIGPVLSAQTLAAGPIAQREGLPYVAVQSGDDGVPEIGDFVYRLTAPELSYQDKTAQCLADRGDVKTATTVYVDSNPTNASWGSEVMPDELEERGVEVTDKVSVEETQTDFSALVTRIIQDAPDAVGLSVFGPQNSTIVSDLRNQGFDGVIFGDIGFSVDTLSAAGAKAVGAIWAADYAPFSDFPSTKKFTEAWEKAHDGEIPLPHNAGGYDAAWFVARALKEADSADRDSVKEGMEAVAAKGFDGATGAITFEGRDARIPGVVIELGEGEKLIPPSCKA